MIQVLKLTQLLKGEIGAVEDTSVRPASHSDGPRRLEAILSNEFNRSWKGSKRRWILTPVSS